MEGMDWSNDECFALIEQYEKHDVLWNLKNPHYLSKHKKNEAWEDIAAILGVEETILRQKMNSLLGSFRAQKSKCRRSVVSEKGTKDVYVSKWFAFEKMQFLLDRSEPYVLFDLQNESNDSRGDSLVEYPVDEGAEGAPNSDSGQRPSAETNLRLLYRKRPRSADDIGDAYTVIKNGHARQQREPEDLCDVYGRYVAAKMRQYGKRTRLAVEHHVNNLLHQADLGEFEDPNEIVIGTSFSMT